MGRGVRAYTILTSKVSDTNYIHRSKEHSDYLVRLMEKGYLPHEWIEFRHTMLSKEKARELEKEYIRVYKPLFNRASGKKLLKFNIEEIKQVLDLRSKGLSYKNIGEKMNCSTMAAYRIINKRSPRYNDIREEFSI